MGPLDKCLLDFKNLDSQVRRSRDDELCTIETLAVKRRPLLLESVDLWWNGWYHQKMKLMGEGRDGGEAS
jgi:hypothetical protein